VVCTNIIYIVGQYPRFLRSSQQLLVVLMDKLREFMSNEFPGIQEMACASFLKVSQGCNEKIIQNEKKGQTVRAVD
jgi:exportin-1